MQTTNTLIRPFKVADAAQVNRVALAAFSQYTSHYADWESFSANIANMSALAETAQLLVAEQDGEIVGAVVFVAPHGQPRAAFFQAEWAIIRMLVVLPSARGLGIGKALTMACLELAGETGAAVCALHTSPIMAVARDMYLRLGFAWHADAPDICGVGYAVYLRAI